MFLAIIAIISIIFAILIIIENKKKDDVLDRPKQLKEIESSSFEKIKEL